ncbi:MAG: penicillin-insensitive murein endopeptidase [Gammaproteobacteria bacterium]
MGLKAARFAANLPPQTRSGIVSAASGAADKLSTIRQVAGANPLRTLQALPTPAGFWIFPLLNELGKALRGATDPEGAEELADAREANRRDEANADAEGLGSNPFSSNPEVTLQHGDDDADHIWGGQEQPEVQASHVADLQRKLVALGYWISHPDTENGRKVDGNYGVSTQGAVACFQLEFFAMDEDGNVDESKISGNLDASTLAALRAATQRPSHVAKSSVPDCVSSSTAVPTPYKQLPSSPYYSRYLPDFQDSASKPYNFLPSKQFRIMSDNWGQTSTIEMIQSVAREWVQNRGKSQFLVGDISAFMGGPMKIGGKAQHQTHQAGLGVDIGHGAYCNITQTYFDPEQALELANLFTAHGATIIYFNCHHVINNNSKVTWTNKHHHHFHVDREWTNSKNKTSCVQCANFSSCSHRIKKVAMKGVSGSQTSYNPSTHGTVATAEQHASTSGWYFLE